MSELLIAFLLQGPLGAPAARAGDALEPMEKAKSPMPMNTKETPSTADDVTKTTERIIQDANEAGKRLANKDPGSQTQKLQREVLDNIDALIRKAQEPPPMDDSADQSPMPKNDASTQKKQASKDSTSESPLNRQERRQRSKTIAKNGGMSSANAKQQKLLPEPKMVPNENTVNKMEPKGFTPRLPASYKDVWGHLPDKMRQEMDLYFREQFMPRYSDLLRQYYSSLAERERKSSPAP